MEGSQHQADKPEPLDNWDMFSQQVQQAAVQQMDERQIKEEVIEREILEKGHAP